MSKEEYYDISHRIIYLQEQLMNLKNAVDKMVDTEEPDYTEEFFEVGDDNDDH